jgi:hypothetical protein
MKNIRVKKKLIIIILIQINRKIKPVLILCFLLLFLLLNSSLFITFTFLFYIYQVSFLCLKLIHGLLSILFYKFHMLSEVRPLHLHISSIINKGFQYYVTKKKSQYDLLRKVMLLFLKILNNIIQLLDNCPNFFLLIQYY